MSTEAGKRNRLINLQSPSGSLNSVGERTTTWTTVHSPWASIEPLTAKTAFLAAQAQSSVTHIVSLLYCSELAAIDASWRVQYGSRIFVIDGVINVKEANTELQLLCAEDKRTE